MGGKRKPSRGITGEFNFMGIILHLYATSVHVLEILVRHGVITSQARDYTKFKYDLNHRTAFQHGDLPTESTVDH